MAKRELSSTLKNLKFMNRAVQREEKAKKEEEEAKANENFSSTTQTRKCIVIMEGNPPPGALKGRMSFLSFNPSIDKLNGESTDQHQPQVPATTSPDEKFADRESGSSQTQSEDFLNSSTNSDFNGDHKRKQPENVSEQLHPSKSSRNIAEGSSPSNRNKSNKKKQQRDKLNWNLLRPPKPQDRMN